QQDIEISQPIYNHPFITMQEFPYPPTNIVATKEGEQVNITWNAPSPEYIRFAQNRDSRAAINYTVWRSTTADIETPGEWIMLSNSVNSTSYTDTVWGGLPFTDYTYIVVANYPNDVTSAPAFSNTLSKDPISHVIVSLGTANQAIVPGALITLTNQNNNPLHVYTQTSSADSMAVHFPEVWYGIYTLTVVKEGYITVSQQNINISQPIYYHPFITMQEFPYPPTNFVATATQTQATLSWNAPSSESVRNSNERNRALTHYTIWRSSSESISNEQSWVTVAENVTGTSYTDTSWAQIAIGNYKYIIKAVYTTGILSEPVISNQVVKNPLSNVTIMLATSDNQPAI
nr:carboxypeptidase-like regulatory domain-containing protein [Candidatus Cloacimonadota bacterium]